MLSRGMFIEKKLEDYYLKEREKKKKKRKKKERNLWTIFAQLETLNITLANFLLNKTI